MAQVADVPQSRVYDVTEQLHEKGLLDIQRSDPKRYFALPVDTALRTLRQGYSANLETAGKHLSALEGRQSTDSGVWEIANRRDVLNRVTMHVGNATNEVYLLVGHDDLLEDELLDALGEKGGDEIPIWVELPSEEARSRLHRDCPDARVTVTDFETGALGGLEQRPGRLLMVDGETILLGAQQGGLVPNDVEESGVWGSSVGHGLVVWIRQLLKTRRERLSFEIASS